MSASAIGIIIAPITARIVRGAVLGVRNLQYIEAAQALGSSHTRIMLRHVLPNVVAPIIVIASIQIGNAILARGGAQLPRSRHRRLTLHPSWGKMLQDTRGFWRSAWWTGIMPGAAISIAVLSFNMFGDALRDVLDPRLRGVVAEARGPQRTVRIHRSAQGGDNPWQTNTNYWLRARGH